MLVLLTFSCNRVEVTRNYIYNSEWGREDGNGFDRIERVYFEIDLGELDEIDVNMLSKNYLVDSTFCYQFYAPNATGKKVYFNRENNGDGFFRKLCSNNLSTKVKTIGALDFETWYRIVSINYKTIHYVYIDKKGNSHVYKTTILGPW
jgi:hypothetical protein